jgi:hypothetical protein
VNGHRPPVSPALDLHGPAGWIIWHHSWMITRISRP